MNYYNEFDPKAAAWIRELINAGAIPPGDVDERSIEDVKPTDLAGYVQCHFFTGIAGWPYALALAGWPSSRPVWTGSCPCQPFSAAGKGAGFNDQRHLWPAWFHLIRECRPAVVFGEQVASKAADPWIDLVQADMEGMGHAFGCVPFSSAGIGAPHIRDRNYWVGDANFSGLEGWRRAAERGDQFAAGSSSVAGRLANMHADGRITRGEVRPVRSEHDAQYGGAAGGLADTDSRQQQGIAIVRWDERDGQDAGRQEGGGCVAACSELGDRPGPVNGHWRDADWIGCRDGKWRTVEPGTQPLAHGIPARVGRLRGYGNAINPHQAAQFVMAYEEAMQDQLRSAA